MGKKRFKLATLVIWQVVSLWLTFHFKFNLFVSTLLFYGVPSIYLSLYYKELFKKIFIFSLAALPVLVVIDYMAVSNGTWYFPYTIFGGRMFGITVFEVIFWFFSYVYYIIIFYECFLDRPTTFVRTRRLIRYPFTLFALIFIFFLTKWMITGSFFILPYTYLIVGVVFAVLPILYTLSLYPKLVTKLAWITLYFCLISFAWELVALHLNQWTFPGNSFIGWLTFGQISFPFEEFLVWIVLGAPTVVCWYEIFDDNQK
ncbi:MAG: hypothetical protein Q8P21_01790 [bacterium]|nr:hypothetical protein [bacterium]